MRLFLSFFILVLMSAIAHADTTRRTVSANRASTVGIHANYNRHTCSGGALPQFRVTQAPKHGSVSFKQGSFKLNEKAGKCAGQRVKGTVVIFKPKSGFRGEDVFKIGYKMEKYAGSGRISFLVERYIIKVK
ncbi:hypothetical protein [Roseibium aggregatum]|uniref:Uncharacterized protein n=1 Tax=Roseibium aggregatum TaxID=187304 RepID=A0A939E9D1_9HYPH|nr:hypothetical protein [Roseibium aggregatum]MBN9669271.1 hypothetical protein [Roseibium aggregatum]